MKTFRNIVLILAVYILNSIPSFALYVKMEKAGILSHYISDEEKYNITELRIDGPINGRTWLCCEIWQDVINIVKRLMANYSC